MLNEVSGHFSLDGYIMVGADSLKLIKSIYIGFKKMMEQKNLVILGGMYFGVTELLKKENENQKFEIDLYDNNPNRILKYTSYDTWVQTSGNLMLDVHIELLGRAIKINYKELFV